MLVDSCIHNMKGNSVIGSLLIAAACFGGYVFGSDIDFLMLHARTKPTRKQDRVIY